MRHLFLIFILCLTPLLHAQEEGDDFFEDEGYDEPYEEPPPDMPRPGEFDGEDSAPDRGRPTGRFVMPPSNSRFNKSPSPSNAPSSPSSRVTRSSEGDEIEFILVDPPKYWKPKKKKRRPLVK